MSRPAPTAPVALARPEGGRKPVWALVLGIASLVTGFAVITLLCAVAAITLASLTFQEISQGGADAGRRPLAVAGMVCGIAALCLWIPVIAGVAISEA